jgi:hypothetical protein
MATTPPFKYQPMFEHGEDKTEYYDEKIYFQHLPIAFTTCFTPD